MNWLWLPWSITEHETWIFFLHFSLFISLWLWSPECPPLIDNGDYCQDLPLRLWFHRWVGAESMASWFTARPMGLVRWGTITIKTQIDPNAIPGFLARFDHFYFILFLNTNIVCHSESSERNMTLNLKPDRWLGWWKPVLLACVSAEGMMRIQMTDYKRTRRMSQS